MTAAHEPALLLPLPLTPALAPGPARIPAPAARSRLKRVLEPVPFLIIHLLPLGALFTGADATAWILCGVLWFSRMFFVTAAYHRYFSHRSFATSRAFQFVLAFMAQTSGQRGALWWAANHRRHHRLSDRPGDPHSPRDGLWHSHIGWLYTPGIDDMPPKAMRDFARFPELRFLNRFWWLPTVTLGVTVLAVWGWGALFIGYFLSTVLLWHATFTVNSLAHVIGTQRYATGDDSRNHWAIALITLGEGWHNNHHHDMGAVRQGRRWWELDVTWYLLVALSWVGLVWDLRPPRSERP